VRKTYDPSGHNYKPDEEVEFREVKPGHFVMCSQEEFEQYKKQNS
jgi:oligopeptide transport system ATP-binding protein